MRNKGFSLAEMMVVILIMSIILAAAAPIITKKASVSETKASSSDPLPAGTIITWAGDGTPKGNWLLCDGTGYDVSQYKDLYNAIHYSYGNDWGKFRVPNLAGRVPVGQDKNSYTTPNVTNINSPGGEPTHTLQQEELPNQSYSGTTGPGITTGQATSTTTSKLYGITTSWSADNPSSFLSAPQKYCEDGNSYGACESWVNRGYTLSQINGETSTTSTTNIVNTHVHNFSVGPLGKGTAYTNMQPYIVVNYYIKY